MNHPCNDWKCPEYNHGQCFGGGCRTNPGPHDEPDPFDDEEYDFDD